MEDENEFVCPETYSISLKQVMPFLLDMSYEELKKGVKPSIVTAAFKLTTEERLEKLRNPTRKYKIGTVKDTFNRCPEAVIFQNFKKGISYTTPLTITNQRTTPKNLKLHFESSRHFSLSMDVDLNHQTKVAPGMSYVINITFLPTDQFRDYVQELKIEGDEDTFTVPLLGLGPRPLVNMSDKITFPPTLVKVPTSTTVLLKNTGLVPMIFVHTIDKPFYGSISKAIVPSNGILESKFYCHPNKTGYITGKLKVYFRNQLCVVTELECEVYSARVELETHLVSFEDVFMGLASQKTLALYNTSEYPLNFSWMMYDEKEEQEEFQKLIDLMSEMKEYQVPKNEKLEFFDIVNAEQHADIYERILEDEKNELYANKREKFLFKSSFFDIIPMVGKVLPKSVLEFTVVFSPMQNTCYYCSAFLDIEGTEKRVRVALQGYGIGPPVMLCVKKLNASQIYLTDKHQYELAVRNKGVIAATVTYQPKKTDWGGTIDCIPNRLVLDPDSTKAFVVVFYSDVQGDFIETLDFIVEESKAHLQCIFTGTVICPLLKCIPDILNLGTVSVGLQHVKDLWLLNDSRVNISFEIEIDDALHKVLKIVPMNGSVKPNDRIKVVLTFASGSLSTWKKNILLIMWNSRQYTKEIPFECVCSCPEMTCIPDVINIKFCFLNCEYVRVIKITNLTDLPGFLEYAPIEGTEGQAIRCIPETTNIYLKARETVEIPIKIIVNALGHHELPLFFSVIGGVPQRLCKIYCNGQGPVISYHPDEVNFGKIDVLRRYTQTLTLINDSPIFAKIRVYCKNKSVFEVQDSALELAPEQSQNVEIAAVLNNAGKIKDTIFLEIFQSDIFNIKVFGEGIGTSILCEPPLAPQLDLGSILTYKNFVQKVTVTNKSSYVHKLLFTKNFAVKSLKEDDQSGNVFIIEPNYLELESNHEATIQIKCSSKKNKSCEEQYFCHALIGKSVQPQPIMDFLILAEFVDPLLKFSKTEFNFNLNVRGSRTDGTTQDVLYFKNKTGIPVQVYVSIDDNFSILEGGERSQQISQGLLEDSGVLREIEYCPTITEKRRHKQKGRIIFEYENHPKTDVINLYGEVMFPTIKLHPTTVDFHCIPLGSTTYTTVVIQNVSAMEVSFKWIWLESSFKVSNLGPVKPRSKFFKIYEENRHSGQNFMDYIDIKERFDNPTREGSGQDVVDSIEASGLFYDTNKYLEEMRKVLFSALAPYIEQKEENLDLVPFKRSSYSQDIMKLFSLEPSEGVLQPYEYTLITIGFSPSPNTEVSAIAICRVFDGEEESLIVKGKSSNLSYVLDKKSVDYGNQVFCETCTDEITITNDGLCSINFKVMIEEILLDRYAEMLDVNPKVGVVAPGNSVAFKVSYFPGFPGQFEKTFTLELGYLDPVTIKVHGYAVVNQVFLHTPRLDFELSITDCYKALSWLTPEYLRSVTDVDKVCLQDDEVTDVTGFLYDHDWTCISYNDQYPSLMDIDLAMERVAAFNHVTQNKNILKDHSMSKKTIHYIPEFSPSPYYVDFGYVVRDIPVCYTILLYNYGPIKADVRLIEDNKTALLEKEFKIEFKNKGMVPGETTELYVLFSPTKRRCDEACTKLEDVFRLTVSHGPIISVKLRAVVTLPSLCLDVDALYFEKVYCGDVLRKNIILRNNGNVPSKWFASISKLTRKKETSTFLVMPKEGRLDPDQKTYLNIYFLPTENIKIKRVLKIDIESNCTPILLDLYGEGQSECIDIVPVELKFQPIISFFEQSMLFNAQNLSNIPIEIYFPTLDKTSEEEKTLIQTYLRYKNLKKILVPFREAGEKLPDFFSNTYERLIEKLRSKMTEPLPEQINENSLEGNNSMSFERKSLTVEDPLAKYTPQEVNSLLMDYITAEGFDNDFSTNATTYRVEETEDSIEIVEPPKFIEEPIDRNGVLLIFHGAPTTDYYKAANQVGIALSLPVYSIDRLIIESLVESSSRYATEIKDRINQAFIELTSGKSSVDLLNRLEKEDMEYDKILDRITLIRTTKPKKAGKKSPSAKDKDSKASSEKSHGKNKDKNESVTECFLNINPDTLVELLRPKMKQFPHLVIEGLNSVFIPKETLGLYTLLKAAGSVYIHLVIMSQTVDDYVRTEAAKITAEAQPVANPSPPEMFLQEQTSPKKSTREKDAAGSKKGGSENKSKTSPVSRKSKGGGTDITKKILQGLNKNLKVELEKFEELLREIVHVSEYWDKRHGSLKKPFNDKSPTSIKKDAVNKDSTRTIKSSGRRHASSTNDEETLIIDELGFHLWVIVNSPRDRPLDFCSIIKETFLADDEFRHILTDVKKRLEETFEECETLFSVISEPSTKTNTLSPAFIIRNYIEPEPFENIRSRSKSSVTDVKTKHRKSSKNSRKSAESKISVKMTDSVSLKHETISEFSTKVVLNPDETFKYQVVFSPVKCGKYNQKYTLESTKTATTYEVFCDAVCEYPSIDFRPEAMFPKTLENYREKASYDHFVYIKDQKIFDFGSIIVGSSPDIYQVYSSDVTLRNVSSSTCIVTVSLSNDNFYIEENSLSICPKSEEKLTIYIKPVKTGTFTTQIYFSIKNNPKIEEYTLACSPCKLEFGVSPKSLGFDKVPVNYRAKRLLRLTNSSPINLRWELVDAEWLYDIFDMSEENGYIGLYSVGEIIFYFSPKEELTFPKKHFQIKVFDVNNTSNIPCFIETLTIHADSVEYNLEIENLIDYGEVKGGAESKYNFPIVNRGKCDVTLKIQLINNPLEHTNFFREFFKVIPEAFSVGAQKTEFISIIFHPTCNLSVQKVLLFVIHMMESVQSEQIVKSYKVSASATVFMPSDKKKMKITKLEIDGFSIVPSSGIVDPNEIFKIPVEFTPREAKEHCEEILLSISEIPDDKKKKVLILKADGCEPRINIRDFDNVFIEQYIVQRLDDFKSPKNIENYCLFVSSEPALYFKLVCLNTEKSINLYFKNVGFVTANLTVKLDDYGKNVFSIFPTNRKVEAYSSCFVEVTFKPNSLEIAHGILEISYNATNENKLTIQLVGEACLPQIKLLKPIPNINEAFLTFDPVCVGYTKSEKICFKNTGQIKCQVILEMCSTEGMFEILPIGNTLDKLNVRDEDSMSDMKRHLNVKLLPEDVAEFEIIFKPIKQQRFKIFLNLHTVLNPFEINKIIIIADSYDKDVIIDGLEALKVDTPQTSKTSLISNDTIGYKLNLGYKELNKLYKTSFSIRNRSSSDIYRFKFHGSSVIFTPEEGHLKPFACKEILAIFKSKEPVLIEMEKIDCDLRKIEYVSPNQDLLSWDDRQKFVYWTTDDHFLNTSQEFDLPTTPANETGFTRAQIRDSVFGLANGIAIIEGKSSDGSIPEVKDKMIAAGVEPEIITIPDFFEIIPLYLSVSADYSRCRFQKNDIEFSDTYIKEKNIQPLEVQNIGAVPLKIKWIISNKTDNTNLKKSSSASSISGKSNVVALTPTSVSSTSLLSNEDWATEPNHSSPFSINPDIYIIEPEKSMKFDVIFGPETVDIFKGTLKSYIEALDPNYQDICIPITGKALLIPFYFEYEDGSYNHKDLSLRFESVGTETESKRNIYLVNPNIEPIYFEIIPKEEKEFSYFVCETPKGRIANKKKSIIAFTFLAQMFGTFEQTYLLKIPEKNVNSSISLEGLCREPKVYFTENNVILKTTVPKVKTVKLLELSNDERFPVAFKFVKKSQYDECQLEKLEIFPLMGKLKPESKMDIRISFVTSNVCTVKFHIKCNVEKLKSPLVLNVTANCLDVQSNVSYTDKFGKVTILNEREVNTIDVGHTHKGKQEMLLFEIRNKGQTGLFYSWIVDTKPISHLFKLMVDVDKGFIKSGTSVTSRLKLQALRIGTLKQFEINLNVSYGPSYIIHLNAISDKPIYSFSFNSYDFGYCFIQKGKTKYYRTTLTFKNLDSKTILLENIFKNTEYLSVESTSSSIQPGSLETIPILFHPQKTGTYRTNICFLIGAMEHSIPISGEGVEIKLELENPKDKFIHFKEVMIESVKKYKVSVINNTPANMNLHFNLFDNLELHRRKTEKLEDIDMKIPIIPPPKDTKKSKDDKKRDKSMDSRKDKQKSDKKSDKGKKQKDEEKEAEVQKAAEALLKQKEEDRKQYLKCFNIIPDVFVDIPPYGKTNFEILFQPSKRMSFEEKIFFETQDHFGSLCIIEGQSVSSEFSLDSSEVLFSNVIVNRKKFHFIYLQNTGDILGSFNWSIEDTRNIFDIEPKQGFVAPKNDMKIKIMFSPKHEKCEYKVKAKCRLKEYKEPLQLILKGNSVKIPDPKETISLNCNVREQDVKSITLANTSTETWIIYPEIGSEVFSTSKEVTALPHSNTEIQITYFPKTMTIHHPHEATMFLETPNGDAVLYRLIGHAGSPSVTKKIEKEVRCKQNHYELLSVRNWLDVKQSFEVTTEVISPITTRTVYKILGLKSIHLKGSETKQYQWGVYLLNDISVEFRVTFKNPESEEYMFYDINVKGVVGDPIDTLNFRTRVREPLKKSFTIENPVDVPITFLIDCAERNLTCDKSIYLEPYTARKVDLTYSPLQVEDITTSLSARCEELGSYVYTLKLHADPPKPEQEVVFNAEFGEKVIKAILFKNRFDRVVDFSYKLNHEDFCIEKCPSIYPGESSKIIISFDPSSLNTVRSGLCLNSVVAGDYIYPLRGEVLPATPKGPFSVRPNYATSIEFKNPFNVEKTFIYQIQSDIFYTEIAEDVIQPKKSRIIPIYVNSTKELNTTVTGKLTVRLVDGTNLEWTYYLQYSQL